MDAKTYVSAFLFCGNLACAVYVMRFSNQYRKKGIVLFTPFFYFAVAVFIQSFLAFVFLYPLLNGCRMYIASIITGFIFISYILFIYFMSFLLGLSERRRKLIALPSMCLPAIAAVISFTNPWTPFFFDSAPVAGQAFFVFTRTPFLLVFTIGILIVFVGMIIITIRSPRVRFRNTGFLNMVLIIAMVLPITADLLAWLIPPLAGIGVSHFCVTLAALIIIQVFWGYLPVSQHIAAEYSDMIYLVFDTFGRCTDINHRGLEFFNANQTSAAAPTVSRLLELTGISLYDLRHGKEQDFQLCRDGQTRYYTIRRFAVSKIHIWGENAIGVAIRDTTRFRMQEQFLTEMANWDPLTKVHNRRFFYTVFANLQSFDAEPTHGVLMVDIDFFKTVNDTWGHLSGDEVLTKIAQRCKDCLCVNDVICRYGGEEFLLLLTGCKPAELPAVAERIRAAIGATPVTVAGGIQIPVTVSVGGYSFTITKDTDVDYVVEQVDAAMYQAKANGRNQVFIAP
ncbi:MAG: diguanylate cyclase [Treponema sp.]|jgi:diguanylate cyclase (GGDEF)-like protein|nr:diguanylate cyclase [Treponema sp.]